MGDTACGGAEVAPMAEARRSAPIAANRFRADAERRARGEAEVGVGSGGAWGAGRERAASARLVEWASERSAPAEEVGTAVETRLEGRAAPRIAAVEEALFRKSRRSRPTQYPRAHVISTSSRI
jgi:hypothetical protein